MGSGSQAEPPGSGGVADGAGAAGRADRIEALGYDYSARQKEPVRDCNLCGSTRLVEVARSDRYGFEVPLWLCSDCGLGFLSPRLTAEEYARFYESVYRPLVSAYHGRTIDAESVQIEQREYAEELADFLATVLPGRPESVIDVGGSTGVVAGVLRARLGCDAAVLDPAPDELAVADAAGMETIAGFVEDYDAGGRTWELALVCQTVDHLLDVAATLRAVRDMLAPAGHAFVDVLDVEFMARRRGSIERAVKIDHPFYLTAASARALFATAGLSVAAERLSDDGHCGFLLAPSEPREPHWEEVRSAADRTLRTIWALRAAG